MTLQNNISFIVIGRNEAETLELCLQSLIDNIVQFELNQAEIIYVDSNSNDDSLKIAKSFEGVSVICLINDYNAAIARNIGAKIAKNEWLVFLDADMELLGVFLEHCYSANFGMKHDFISSNWNNIYIEESVKVQSRFHRNLDHDVYESVTGGFFAIRKSLWFDNLGMRQKYRISQDIDFGLRLARRRILLLRIKEIGVNHYTKNYLAKERLWKDFRMLNHLFARSLIYRDHFMNPYMYSRLIRHDYTMLILLVSLLIYSIVFNNISVFMLYLLMISFKVFKEYRGISVPRIELYFYYLARDITVIIGIIFFWPKTKFNVKTSQVK